MFLKFKDYILALAGEQSLTTTLRRLAYSINQGVPKLVRGKLETVYLNFFPLIIVYSLCKYALPLLCLLLERAVWTMGVSHGCRKERISIPQGNFITGYVNEDRGRQYA